VGEALMIMSEKGVPIVRVKERLLDARTVLNTIWENRGKEIGSVNLESALKRKYETFSASMTINELLEEVEIKNLDYVIVEHKGSIEYLTWGKVAAKLIEKI
jgi:hypothetical protein